MLLRLLLVVPVAVAARDAGGSTTQWPTPKPAPVVSIADIAGAKPDNRTSNTRCFRAAVAKIASAGGGTLLVPEGTWLTGPFNLTSNMTLYLESGATLQGSTDLAEWPLMPPMKSYGQGRDHPGPRHVSLLHGFHLSALTIGGENGTVNGGGPFWWHRHRSRDEQHTRGHLFECMNCTDLLMQDVTLRDSPFWTVHPVFSRRVVARRLTVLNDNHSPNTDGFVSRACRQR
jgi:polygalacturonase